jgi:hypothetical protein
MLPEFALDAYYVTILIPMPFESLGQINASFPASKGNQFLRQGHDALAVRARQWKGVAYATGQFWGL